MLDMVGIDRNDASVSGEPQPSIGGLPPARLGRRIRCLTGFHSVDNAIVDSWNPGYAPIRETVQIVLVRHVYAIGCADPKIALVVVQDTAWIVVKQAALFRVVSDPSIADAETGQARGSSAQPKASLPIVGDGSHREIDSVPLCLSGRLSLSELKQPLHRANPQGISGIAIDGECIVTRCSQRRRLPANRERKKFPVLKPQQLRLGGSKNQPFVVFANRRDEKMRQLASAIQSELAVLVTG